MAEEKNEFNNHLKCESVVELCIEEQRLFLGVLGENLATFAVKRID